MWISMKKHGAECPISKVVGLLGDSCSILILRDLLESPKRYSELEESLESSSRTLVKKLKHLESEGLIKHIPASKKRPHSSYQLTKKGAAFEKVADAMRAYGKKFL